MSWLAVGSGKPRLGGGGAAILPRRLDAARRQVNGQQEPHESRDSRVVLWEPAGEIPLGHPTLDLRKEAWTDPYLPKRAGIGEIVAKTEDKNLRLVDMQESEGRTAVANGLEHEYLQEGIRRNPLVSRCRCPADLESAPHLPTNVGKLPS